MKKELLIVNACPVYAILTKINPQRLSLAIKKVMTADLLSHRHTINSWMENRQLSPSNLINKPFSIQMYSFMFVKRSLIHQLHCLEVMVGKKSICWIAKLLAAAETGNLCYCSWWHKPFTNNGGFSPLIKQAKLNALQNRNKKQTLKTPRNQLI